MQAPQTEPATWQLTVISAAHYIAGIDRFAPIMACTSVVQPIVDARLNSVYQAWTEALRHPKSDEAKDDAEILKRLVAAERAWIDFRDKDCNLQSTSMPGGTG